MDIFFVLIELLGWVGALVWASTAINRYQRGSGSLRRAPAIAHRITGQQPTPDGRKTYRA
jgi:hypothetical protein